MKRWLRQRVDTVYERLLSHELAGAPTHIAVIQDGNRRYARQNGDEAHEGHRAGAETTERVLEWCQEIGVEELTLYTFSTENFDRPDDQKEALFDLLCDKLHEFADADRVHDNGVCIRAIGEIEMLPERVQDAVDYAEEQTGEYDDFVLNIALAYGGRSRLLEAARGVAREVDSNDLESDDIDVETIEQRLYDQPVRDVDLIIRPAGEERTSNFLPWHANGNEAAVFFCTPYWPEFSKSDFSGESGPTNTARSPGDAPVLGAHLPCSALSAKPNSPKPSPLSTAFVTRCQRLNGANSMVSRRSRTATKNVMPTTLTASTRGVRPQIKSKTHCC